MDEGQRQALVLALAELALSRPGWDDMLREIAKKFDPELSMYVALMRANADRVRSTRGPLYRPLPGAPYGPSIPGVEDLGDLGPFPAPQIAQTDPELLDWILGVQNGQAGGFLTALAEAAVRADIENYPVLRPVIAAMAKKFPQYTDIGRKLGRAGGGWRDLSSPDLAE